MSIEKGEDTMPIGGWALADLVAAAKAEFGSESETVKELVRIIDKQRCEIQAEELKSLWQSCNGPNAAALRPADGVACWVVIDGEVFFAYADAKAPGGWTSGDVWEDYASGRRYATHFMIADVPQPPTARGQAK